jgi:UDP-N-acetylmuramate dehydrogenase
LTSYKTGGRAKYFFSAQSGSEVTRAIEAARKLQIPYFVLGGGTNLLVSDAGYDGLVIKVDVTGIRLIEDTLIECGAGEELMALVDFATQYSLTGMEFAAGIWGSVGGAVYGNAGAFGGEIGNVIESVRLVEHSGKLKQVSPDYCKFAYRDSYLKVTHEVVVDIRLRLAQAEREVIAAKVTDILAQRDGKHPNDGMSAGCFFKNIPDPREKYGKLPAGRLLEEIGAKQLQVGGAKVFERHANIIVNSGTATSRDIRELADILKARVKERFGIELQEEVQQLGTFEPEA